LSEPFTLTVQLVSTLELEMKALLLSKAVFKVFYNGVLQREVSGIISAFERGKSGFARTFYSVTIRPQLWLLTQRQSSRIFHFKSLPEVINQLLHEHGVSFSHDLYDSHLPREYVTQKRETDYQFLNRLAAEEGISFWFDSQAGYEQCYYSDRYLSLTGGLTLAYNDHPQSLSEGEYISQMRLAVQMTPQQMTGKDRLYQTPDYDYEHTARHQTVKANADHYRIYDSYARFA